MKNIFIICFLYVSAVAWSCDICGCSLMGNYTGSLPMLYNHYAGVRYSMQSFDSHLLMHTAMHSKEHINTAEVLLKWNIKNKVQVHAVVPFAYNIQTQQETIYESKGISDLKFWANYILFDSKIDTGSKIKHIAVIGGGMKLPTGSFDAKSNINPNLRTGSGSYDILINALYSIRSYKIIQSISANYKYNNSNDAGFRFGNMAWIGYNLQYLFNKYKYSVMPGAVCSYEILMPNKKYGYRVEYTGGTGLLAGAGIDIIYKQLTINATIQIPVYQSYNDNNTTVGHKASVSVAYLY
ncbi:MAG: hypothetical protein NW207_01480 [Cytophagales bacterium]|nr:hypothetical protein [Cytophagales bacterium]